jgi:hypothetical protein
METPQRDGKKEEEEHKERRLVARCLPFASTDWSQTDGASVVRPADEGFDEVEIPRYGAVHTNPHTTHRWMDGSSRQTVERTE